MGKGKVIISIFRINFMLLTLFAQKRQKETFEQEIRQTRSQLKKQKPLEKPRGKDKFCVTILLKYVARKITRNDALEEFYQFLERAYNA